MGPLVRFKMLFFGLSMKFKYRNWKKLRCFPLQNWDTRNNSCDIELYGETSFTTARNMKNKHLGSCLGSDRKCSFLWRWSLSFWVCQWHWTFFGQIPPSNFRDASPTNSTCLKVARVLQIYPLNEAHPQNVRRIVIWIWRYFPPSTSPVTWNPTKSTQPLGLALHFLFLFESQREGKINKKLPDLIDKIEALLLRILFGNLFHFAQGHCLTVMNLWPFPFWRLNRLFSTGFKFPKFLPLFKDGGRKNVKSNFL